MATIQRFFARSVFPAARAVTLRPGRNGLAPESRRQLMSNAAPAGRAHWSSRWAFILVTAGSAIGLGNIWKFPYMTGTNGGSAFVLVYLACIIGIGLPLLMAEVMLGRRGQENPADTMRLLAREARVSPWWQAVGFIGIFGALFILSFY